jgi:hypothetical protein
MRLLAGIGRSLIREAILSAGAYRHRKQLEVVGSQRRFPISA